MQDAHLAFDDLVNGRDSSGHARFLKRLQNKTLLDDWPYVLQSNQLINLHKQKVQGE